MADSRPRARRDPAAAGNPRFRQRRHRLAADDGRRRRPRNHRDLRRRRLAPQAADAAHPRSAAAHGRGGPVRGRGRALSDRAQGRARSWSDRISHPRRLGPDQVGRSSRRAQRARRNHGDRGASLARPYREDACSFRRRRHGRARRRRAADHARRPAGVAPDDRRRSRRSLVGGVPDCRRADCSGFRHRRRRGDDEPAQDRAPDDVERDGRPYRDARPAPRGRRGGRGLAGAHGHACAASTFRPRARPR